MTTKTKKQSQRSKLFDELKSLSTAAERGKLIERAGEMAEKSFHDNSFTELILDLKTPNLDDLVPSSSGQGLSEIVHLEPSSRAMILAWRNKPDSQYVNAPKAEIPFIAAQSPDMEAYQEELLASSIPMTTHFKNIGRDLADAVDGHFIGLAKGCVAMTGQYSVVEGPFGKQHMRAGFDGICRNRKQAATLLIPSTSHNAMCAGGTEFFGSSLAAEVVTHGYQHQVILGRKLVVTNKCRLLTSNPYAPLVDGAVTAFDGPLSQAVHDPAYPFGTNLNGLAVNGKSDFGRYPRKPLINGRFVPGISSKKSGTNASAPTTATWAGNTNFVFTSSEFLGKYGRLQPVTVYLDQIMRKVRWGGYTIIGLGITQVDSVSMVVSV